MKYDLNYMLTHDIDWFCIINGVYVHVASAGGILPEKMRDREQMRTLQHNVAEAEYLYTADEIEYNEKFLQSRFNDGKGRADYIRSFTDMARKGFVSLDRTNWMNPDDNTYHIVCRPKDYKKVFAREYGEDIISYENEVAMIPFDNVEAEEIRLLEILKQN